MLRLIPFLVFIHFFTTAGAQSSLCLTTAAGTGSIDFKPDELNSLLQLDKHRIVFFGEQHNSVFDPEIKYHLIADQNRRTGLRHVFLEISFSAAWNLNQYLKTGDTAYLYNTVPSKSHTAYSRLWTRLYAYNSGLPDSLKIVIHGVDFETTGVFRTLKKLSPAGQSVPAALRPVMDTIEAHLQDKPLAMWAIVGGKFVTYDNAAFTSTLRYVQKQFLADPELSKTYFGANYPVVEDIITNDGPVEVRAKPRNRTMFTAMKRIVNERKIDRFIGFFGGQHTTYTVGNSLANAASRLDGFDKKDILNIAEFAYDLSAKETAFRSKHFKELVALNGVCKATVLQAAGAPGFKNDADFVILADISE